MNKEQFTPSQYEIDSLYAIVEQLGNMSENGSQFSDFIKLSVYAKDTILRINLALNKANPKP